MEKYNNANILSNTQEVIDEHTSLQLEENDNSIYEPDLDTLQSKEIKNTTALLPSDILEGKLNAYETLKESDAIVMKPVKAGECCDFKVIGNLEEIKNNDNSAGNGLDSEERKLKNNVCGLISDQTDKCFKGRNSPETSFQVIDHYSSHINNNRGQACSGNFIRISSQILNQITLSQILSSGWRNINITQKCVPSSLNKINLDTLKGKPYFTFKGISPTNHVSADYKRRNLIVSEYKRNEGLTLILCKNENNKNPNAEVETMYNSPADVFQSQMHHARDALSLSNYNEKLLSVLMSSNNKYTNSTDQQSKFPQLKNTTKINNEELQILPDKGNKYDIDILKPNHDWCKEKDDCNIHVKKESRNDTDVVICEVDSSIYTTDIFGSNSSSPVYNSISEEVTNALNVLDANLENEHFDQSKEESIDLDRSWSDIDVAVNSSIKKYEHFTADKSTLAVTSTAEKVCQTDISYFKRNSCKRPFEDDNFGCIKKKTISRNSKLDDEIIQYNLQSDQGNIEPINEEFLNSEEFLIMNNKDICWSPVNVPETPMTTKIYTEQDIETDEINDDKSLFDDAVEQDELNLSSKSYDSETVEWDQLVPPPNADTAFKMPKGYNSCLTIPKKPVLRVGLSKTARLKSLHNKMKPS